MHQHTHHVLLDFSAHATEAKHVLINSLSNVLHRLFLVEDVLLKEGVLSIHVRAVEESITINNIIPETPANILRVVILFTLDVILVRGHVFLDPRGNHCVCTVAFCLHLGSCLLGVLIVVEVLDATELLIQINKDICS